MNATKRISRSLTPAMLTQAARALRVLAHAQRLRIVNEINNKGELPVRELTRRTGLTQAMTSQHLNRLRHVGLVVARRHGREVWYAIADRRCVGVLACIRGRKERKA